MPLRDVDALLVFTTLRRYIVRDLRRIAQMKQGGNYAVALLVVTSCDALGRAFYKGRGDGAAFFRDYMSPEDWKPTAKSVYDALRNGLVHRYETKGIVLVGGRRIEIGVSWRDYPHFHLDVARGLLTLNVRSLVRDVAKAFSSVRARLRAEPKFRAQFAKFAKAGAEVQVQAPKDVQAWAKIVAQFQQGAA